MPHHRTSCSVALARSFALLFALALTAACPGADDGTAETGSMGTAATAATTSVGTADDTGSGGSGGAPAVCSYDDAPWTFVDTLDMPAMRGVGAEDGTCNPVTTDTVALQVQVIVPEGIVLDPSGTVRVLLFEADPFVADAGADCVGGLCESLDGASLTWSFEVPNDQPDFTYYIVVDIDADGPEIDGCTLSETDFVTFFPGQSTLMVPMTADGCV